ncbi:MAG TPA: lysophospholipid acyltransferase family protein [Jatrophihabitantaceae bacterium]|nr:lysophospholipid acyltransferase family protein [Jatrophihabitantaceae bacterium]
MTRLHKPKAGFWIRLCVVILYPLDALLFRIRWHNLDRIPAPSEGGCIIAMNHISHVDTVLMARFVWQSGRVPRFMIKASLFSKPVTGPIFKGAKQIPVYRGTADAAESLRDAVSALERGECIVIYPEGTITKDPAQWPMQGKTGIARLVLLAPDIPVIPVGQWGAQQRKGSANDSRRFGRRQAQASVGKPVELGRFRGAEPTAANLREITDTIMTAIRDEVAVLRGEQAPVEFYKPSKKYVDTAGPGANVTGQ